MPLQALTPVLAPIFTTQIQRRRQALLVLSAQHVNACDVFLTLVLSAQHVNACDAFLKTLRPSEGEIIQHSGPHLLAIPDRLLESFDHQRCC